MKSAARVRLDSRGVVTVETYMTDIGTGSYTVIAQTGAEMLGVTLEVAVASPLALMRIANRIWPMTVRLPTHRTKAEPLAFANCRDGPSHGLWASMRTATGPGRSKIETSPIMLPSITIPG